MEDEQSREELEKRPVPDNIRAELWADDEVRRDRLITFLTGYWYTLAALHGVMLSAASIVAAVQPDRPKWLYAIISASSIVGLAAVATAFQVMRKSYDASLLHSSDLKNMATLDDHYRKQQQYYPVAGKLKRQRQRLEKASKWTALCSIVCLIGLVLAPEIEALLHCLARVFAGR